MPPLGAQWGGGGGASRVRNKQPAIFHTNPFNSETMKTMKTSILTLIQTRECNLYHPR